MGNFLFCAKKYLREGFRVNKLMSRHLSPMNVKKSLENITNTVNSTHKSKHAKFR